jgi:ring-1,2-phenylacetyl-CoA epoxidase subunit PaaD
MVDLREIEALVAQLPDPEIPVVTLADLGILRAVRQDSENGTITVEVTPTYSGCPATETIRADIYAALAAAGVVKAQVNIVLQPAWTTDWMSAAGREKLRAYGIAPPACTAAEQSQVLHFKAPSSIACPLCKSHNTERLSEFGSTPCKALYRCRACREPFDYFKPF